MSVWSRPRRALRWAALVAYILAGCFAFTSQFAQFLKLLRDKGWLVPAHITESARVQEGMAGLLTLFATGFIVFAKRAPWLAYLGPPIVFTLPFVAAYARSDAAFGVALLVGL